MSENTRTTRRRAISESRRDQVSSWFRSLRDEICAAVESIETCQEAKLDSERDPGRFVPRRTSRRSGGGGLMSIMRNGRIFEKMGVNVSTVHGELSEEARNSLTSRREIRG